MKLDLWKDVAFKVLGDHSDFSASSLGNVLMKSILQKEEGTLFTYYKSGYMTEQFCIKNLDELIQKDGARLIAKNILNDSNYNYIYVWSDAIFSFNYNPNNKFLNSEGFSQKESLLESVDKYINNFILPDIQSGHIFSVVKQGQSLALQSIGAAGIDLERGNYSSKVIEDYDFMVNDLRSDSPFGRISILSGVAGSGKTHIVRSLLSQVQDAMFVLIPPDYVSSLGGAEFLPLLMQNKQDIATKGSIILVLEDSDCVLVKRMGDNINSIQSLLNLSDGILGSLLDIRVVATTNATKLEIDPAILRTGRLSKQIEVNHLDLETARNIYLRLLPKTKQFPKKLEVYHSSVDFKIILSDIYSLARENGWISENKKKSDKPTGNLNFPFIDTY